MRFRQILSLLAALVLVAACETAGTGGTEQGGTSGQTTSQAPAPAPSTQPVQEALNSMLARVGDRVFFDFDKSDLKPAARNTVQGWANWLRSNPGADIVIEGHADERGTREYNLALGERRATAVKDYLVALGVAPSRVRTISYGKERPEDPGHNDSAWAKNRRGVLVAQ